MILPELGHVVRERDDERDGISAQMRHDDDAADLARRFRSMKRARCSSRASRSIAPNAWRSQATAACSPTRSSPRSTCRRSIARRWTATRCSPRTRSAPSRYEPRTLRAIEKVYTGQVPRRVAARRVHRDRDRRADARRRRRGRDGRGNRTQRATIAVRVLTPVYPRQHVGRRGADIAAGQPVLRPATCSTRAASARSPPPGMHRGRGLREPARRDPLDRQRDRRTRAAARPGQIYDINRFTLAAIIAAHGGVPVGPHRPRADTLATI